jgi:hypothetical protein
LYNFATKNSPLPLERRIWAAELIREVSLKCIPFNGLPRTINALGQFRAELPADIAKSLSTEQNLQWMLPGRQSTNSSISQDPTAQGRKLWDSIYTIHSDKLLLRLGHSHPDLPTVILGHHYPFLASTRYFNGRPLLNRLLTSTVAVSCLRAQQGSSRQLESHIYGLKNAEIGEDIDQSESNMHLMKSDHGCIWIIEVVDSIVQKFKVCISHESISMRASDNICRIMHSSSPKSLDSIDSNH